MVSLSTVSRAKQKQCCCVSVRIETVSRQLHRGQIIHFIMWSADILQLFKYITHTRTPLIGHSSLTTCLDMTFLGWGVFKWGSHNEIITIGSLSLAVLPGQVYWQLVALEPVDCDTESQEQELKGWLKVTSLDTVDVPGHRRWNPLTQLTSLDTVDVFSVVDWDAQVQCSR